MAPKQPGRLGSYFLEVPSKVDSGVQLRGYRHRKAMEGRRR